MVPHLGFILTFSGSVLAYVGARLVNSDNLRLEGWRKYQAILGQVHADGKVTTDEAAILAKERQMLKISREDHEAIIRRTVADPAAQQRLLAMHDAPIDIEHVLRNREFQTYKRSLVQAYSDGRVTNDESELLRTQREGLGITDADHEAMLNELIASGEIMVSGPVPSSKPVPGPAGPPIPPPVPPPSNGAPQSSPMRPPADIPGGTSLPSRPVLYAGPPPAGKPAETGPAGPVSLLSGSVGGPPPAAPTPAGGPGMPLKLVKCTKCGETIPVFSEQRPLELECSKCGFKGMLRK
jgi:DNA-directed RNA polymerase subunit RPC12/RpoP